MLLFMTLRRTKLWLTELGDASIGVNLIASIPATLLSYYYISNFSNIYYTYITMATENGCVIIH